MQGIDPILLWLDRLTTNGNQVSRSCLWIAIARMPTRRKCCN